MTRQLLALLGMLGALTLTGCGNSFGFAQAQADPFANPQDPAAGGQEDPAADFQAEDAKHPIIKALLNSLKELGNEGSEEERKLIRQLLHDADEELANSLGKNPHKKIVAANKRRQAFRIHTRDAKPDIDSIRNQLKEKPAEPKAAEEAPQESATPGEAKAAPAPPSE